MLNPLPYLLLRLTAIVSVCAVGLLTSPASAVGNHWQLTLNYTESGDLELLSADSIASSAKTPRTPNRDGGIFEIPIRVEWLGPDQKPIFTTQALLPLGTRLMCAEENPVPGFIMPKNLAVLRVPGPAEGVANQVRISRQVTISKRSSPVNAPDLSGDFTFPLTTPKTRRFSPPPPVFPTTKLSDTGPDGSRLVIIVMGDGYRQAEIDSGKFAADVDRTLAAFETASPWDQMLRATNIYRVDVPSVQSGADFENGLGGVLKDTYFDTGFFSRGIPVLLAPSESGAARATAIADATAGAGLWDQIILVVNSTVYGGAGGPLTTASVNANGPRIAVHEVGHSFPGLADEYGGNIRIYDGLPITEPNVSLNPINPSWAAWIDSPAPPLPTPDNGSYNTVVGTFEGGRYFDSGIYRPMQNCKMRSINAEFCPICKEQHLKSFFEIVPFAESTSPAASTVVPVTNSRTFTVDSPPLDDISYEWFINDQRIPGENTASLSLTTGQLVSLTQQLSVNARYASDMMRTGQPTAAFSWTVENEGVTSSGTPHWWLASNNLGVSTGEDQIDHDGDGQLTAAEYLAGTNPNNRGSTLKFSTVNLAPSDGLLEFQTVQGRRYRLERATTLSDWEPIPGYDNIAGGPTVNYPVPTNRPTKRFYRIAVWIP